MGGRGNEPVRIFFPQLVSQYKYRVISEILWYLTTVFWSLAVMLLYFLHHIPYLFLNFISVPSDSVRLVSDFPDILLSHIITLLWTIYT